MRNNNPLNIRHSKDQWEGMAITQTDKAFVQFQTLAYGYRAAWKVLESYWKHCKQERKMFTVGSIIERWAPRTENDTDAYIRTVLSLTALGGNERLPRPFKGIALDKLGRLVAAMTVVECGIRADEVDMQAVWEGYDMAFPGKRKLGREQYHPGSVLPGLPAQTTRPLAELMHHWDEYWDWSPQAYA